MGGSYFLYTFRHGLCKKKLLVCVCGNSRSMVILFLGFSLPCVDLGGENVTKVSIYQAIHVLPLWHKPKNLYFSPSRDISPWPVQKNLLVCVCGNSRSMVILLLGFSRPCMDLGGKYKTEVSKHQAIHGLPLWHKPKNLYFRCSETFRHSLCKKICLCVSV